MPRVEIRAKTTRGYRVLGLGQLFTSDFSEIEITDGQLAALAEEPSQFVEFRVLGKAVTGRQDVADTVTAEQPQHNPKRR